MSKSHPAPVPPAGRSTKDPAIAEAEHNEASPGADSRQRNIDKQGRQGNIKVNTTNQGYQQDR